MWTYGVVIIHVNRALQHVRPKLSQVSKKTRNGLRLGPDIGLLCSVEYLILQNRQFLLQSRFEFLQLCQHVETVRKSTAFDLMIVSVIAVMVTKQSRIP